MQTKNILIASVALIGVIGAGAGAIYITRTQPPMAPTEVVEASPSATTPSTTLPTESSVPGAQQVQTQSVIQSVVMNTTGAGPDVSLLSHQASFKSTDATIFTSVMLAPTVTADKVILKITFSLDGTKLGPVTAAVKTQGDKKYATFQMTKPPAGWPIGDYLATIALPTGATKEVKFSVK